MMNFAIDLQLTIPIYLRDLIVLDPTFYLLAISIIFLKINFLKYIIGILFLSALVLLITMLYIQKKLFSVIMQIVENLALTINYSPEPRYFSSDNNSHFVQILFISSLRPALTDFLSCFGQRPCVVLRCKETRE